MFSGSNRELEFYWKKIVSNTFTLQSFIQKFLLSSAFTAILFSIQFEEGCYFFTSHARLPE